MACFVYGGAMDFEQHFRDLVTRYLGRPWTPSDGVAPAVLSAAERRLGERLPQALRAFYATSGVVGAFVSAHHQVLSPERLVLESGHLCFMEENQSVVTWGIPHGALSVEDPEVWQRNNTPPQQWFSEEKTVTAFFESMLHWYSEMGILAKVS